jgi:hypothetical protein
MGGGGTETGDMLHKRRRAVAKAKEAFHFFFFRHYQANATPSVSFFFLAFIANPVHPVSLLSLTFIMAIFFFVRKKMFKQTNRHRRLEGYGGTTGP